MMMHVTRNRTLGLGGLGYGGGRGGYGGPAWTDGVAGSIVGLALLLLLVLLVIAAFLLWKAINFLIVVFARYPYVRALWGALAVCLGTWLLAALSIALLPPSDALSQAAVAASVVAPFGLLVVARVVQIQQEDVFQATPEPLYRRVLARSWWESPAR